jgi:hypothetical protein
MPELKNASGKNASILFVRDMQPTENPSGEHYEKQKPHLCGVASLTFGSMPAFYAGKYIYFFG